MQAKAQGETSIIDTNAQVTVQQQPQGSGGQTGMGAARRDTNIRTEEDAGTIEFTVLRNDKTLENMRTLIELKNVIAKQLPRMPRPYIVRLIMDRVHEAMVILKRRPNGKSYVLGGCVFRPFYQQKFAEIVFLAITTSEQVKGYGTRLMNRLKDYAKEHQLYYFLTYADNNAIEYFKKQGFTKTEAKSVQDGGTTVHMPERRWKGYIKDYNGSTMMQCAVHRDVTHSTFYEDIREAQRTPILKLIQQQIQIKVMPGLHFNSKKVYSFSEVPGLTEAGWTEELEKRGRQDDERSFEDQCEEILQKLLKHENSWPFRESVDRAKVPDYYEVIQKPMDLKQVKSLVDTLPSFGGYDGISEFKKDIALIFNNARSYNQKETIYYKYANQLEQLVKADLERMQDTPRDLTGKNEIKNVEMIDAEDEPRRTSSRDKQS